MTRTANYARSSPDCPLPADQRIDELNSIAAARRWGVEHVFTDHPTSVKKGQDRRPGEDWRRGDKWPVAIRRVEAARFTYPASPPGPNSSRSGCGTRIVYQFWTSASWKVEGGEGQAGTERRL